MQTCYAKWLSICSGYCEFNALVHVHCVEWNCHYFFFFFICRILACTCRLLVLPYYMVNKDEYISIGHETNANGCPRNAAVFFPEFVVVARALITEISVC